MNVEGADIKSRTAFRKVCFLLGGVRYVRKITNSDYLASLCPSDRMGQLDSYMTDFHEIF